MLEDANIKSYMLQVANIKSYMLQVANIKSYMLQGANIKPYMLQGGGNPARRLALKGQHWDWSARCEYTVTGWGRTFDLQLLSQCGST